jgi:hypothetical protein
VSPANGAGAGVLAGFRSSQSQSLAEMRTHPEGRGSSVVGRFYKSRRGTAALEFVIVASVLLFSFLFPIGDLAVAGLTYIRTKEAIRELGAFAQYNPPSDLTDVSSKNWTNLPTKVGDFTVAIGTQFPTGKDHQYHRIMRHTAVEWGSGWCSMHVRKSNRPFGPQICLDGIEGDTLPDGS